jgi:chemotaxis protein histidine kinase CheA
MYRADALAQLIHGFVAEASDLCESVTRDLLALERSETRDFAARNESVARALHTLKGAAGTLGLEDLELLAHRLEDVVAAQSSAQQPIASLVADVVLRGLDAFMFRLRAHADGSGVTLDAIEDVLASGLTALAPALPTGPPDDAAAAFAEALKPSQAPLVAGGPQTWRVDPDQVTALMKEIERLRVVRLRLDARRRDVARIVSIVNESWRGPASTEVRSLLAGMDAAAMIDRQEVLDIVQALEDGVKTIGTQPVRVVVDPLYRAVRDLCRTTGKEAKLSLVGGEISLDRRVLEALKGPLVHLIRNAVDHGIETPQVRRSRGKHEEGSIVVRVEQQGNVVFIEVSDDGDGLKLDAIRRAALDKGAVTEDEMARMAPEDLSKLIFLPSVSTAESVTATSGRGIGMDAVKKNLEQLRGSVEVQSVARQGTRVLMTFPAQLGSSPLLIVRVGEGHFAVPLVSVESVATAQPHDLRGWPEEARFERGEKSLRVVDLSELLESSTRRSAPPTQILVIHSQGQRVALGVDEIVGDLELIIRPLPRELASVATYQGASVLAHGEIVLILRPDWLVGVRDVPRMSSAPPVS